MKKYYCDLCETETQPLEHHDFTQCVQINEIMEMDVKEYFVRFYVCDSCRDIWRENAKAMVERVKYLCSLSKRRI